MREQGAPDAKELLLVEVEHRAAAAGLTMLVADLQSIAPQTRQTVPLQRWANVAPVVLAPVAASPLGEVAVAPAVAGMVITGMVLQVLSAERYSAGVDTDASADPDPAATPQPQPQTERQATAATTTRDGTDRERNQCGGLPRWNPAAARTRVAAVHTQQLAANWDAYRAARASFPASVSRVIRNFRTALRTDTMAAEIAVVTHDGCVLAQASSYRHVGVVPHAEEMIVPTPLGSSLPNPIPPGSWLAVVVNSPPCPGEPAPTRPPPPGMRPRHRPNCEQLLRDFAASRGLVWQPQIPFENQYLQMPDKTVDRAVVEQLVRSWWRSVTPTRA